MQSIFTIQSKFKPLDFSAGSELSQLTKKSSVADFSAVLFDSLSNSIGYGGYLEKRDFYERSHLFFDEKYKQYRNIHLGVDFWAKVGTEIISPFDANVHSYQYNAGKLDYGNTIILETKQPDKKFYLLFGHLSNQSLKYIKNKSFLKKGETVGWLGNECENGGWPAHLHLQIIKNLQGKIGDYPGLCCEAELPFYQENCPNPLDFL